MKNTHLTSEFLKREFNENQTNIENELVELLVAEAEGELDSVTENKEVNPDNITRSEIRKMSKRISGIDKRLETIKSQRKKLRRESGRVRSYQKITSGRGRKIRLTDVKERASTGGSLNANELSALLDSGSLTGITSEASKPESTKSNAPRKGRTGKKGMRRLGVTRGGPRKGNSASRRE